MVIVNTFPTKILHPKMSSSLSISISFLLFLGQRLPPLSQHMQIRLRYTRYNTTQHDNRETVETERHVSDIRQRERQQPTTTRGDTQTLINHDELPTTTDGKEKCEEGVTGPLHTRTIRTDEPTQVERVTHQLRHRPSEEKQRESHRTLRCDIGHDNVMEIYPHRHVTAHDVIHVDYYRGVDQP